MYSYQMNAWPSYNASNTLGNIAPIIKGLSKPKAPDVSVIMDPQTANIHQAVGDGAEYGEYLGRMAYGASAEAFPVSMQEPEQEAAWMVPSLERKNKMDVYTMADGSLRAGAEYAKRHNALLNRGESLNTPNPVYQGAEIDLVDVAEHLRVLKLLSMVQGFAPRKFHTARGVHHEIADWLDFRIAIADPNVGDGYRQGPHAPMQRTRSDFYEAEVTCRKDREAVGYPYETTWRANKINPTSVDAKNAAWSLAYKRNKSVIAELLNIGNRVGPNGQTGASARLSSMTDRVNTHGKSENNVLAEIHNIKSAQGVANLVDYDTIQMNPLPFLFFTQNDFTRGGSEFGRTPISMPSGGIVQLPTIGDIMVILDVRLPLDRMFFYERETCVWLGEGPKRVDTLEDKDRQARYADVTDWYDVTAIHPQIKNDTDRFFGCTVFFAANDVNIMNAGG